MREFPMSFGGGMGGGYGGGMGGGGMGMGAGMYSGSPQMVSAAPGSKWNGHALCDGKRADDRAKWLVENEGMTVMNARNMVMNQFPQQFGGGGGGTQSLMVSAPEGAKWNGHALCDGKRADDRAKWLQENE